MKMNVKEYKALLNPGKENKDEYTDIHACSNCKAVVGSCCETMGCELSPKDLKTVDVATILGLLKSGVVCIDYYEGDLEFAGYNELDQVYYLRARMEPDMDKVCNPAWYGTCKLLMTTGCILPFEYRPYYGRTSVCPYMSIYDKSKDNSDGLNSKQRSCLEWRPYQDIIMKACWTLYCEQNTESE